MGAMLDFQDEIVSFQSKLREKETYKTIVVNTPGTVMDFWARIVENRLLHSIGAFCLGFTEGTKKTKREDSPLYNYAAQANDVGFVDAYRVGQALAGNEKKIPIAINLHYLTLPGRKGYQRLLDIPNDSYEQHLRIMRNFTEQGLGDFILSFGHYWADNVEDKRLIVEMRSKLGLGNDLYQGVGGKLAQEIDENLGKNTEIVKAYQQPMPTVLKKIVDEKRSDLLGLFLQGQAKENVDLEGLAKGVRYIYEAGGYFSLNLLGTGCQRDAKKATIDQKVDMIFFDFDKIPKRNPYPMPDEIIDAVKEGNVDEIQSFIAGFNKWTVARSVDDTTATNSPKIGEEEKSGYDFAEQEKGSKVIPHVLYEIVVELQRSDLFALFLSGRKNEGMDRHMTQGERAIYQAGNDFIDYTLVSQKVSKVEEEYLIFSSNVNMKEIPNRSKYPIPSEIVEAFKGGDEDDIKQIIEGYCIWNKNHTLAERPPEIGEISILGKIGYDFAEQLKRGNRGRGLPTSEQDKPTLPLYMDRDRGRVSLLIENIKDDKIK